MLPILRGSRDTGDLRPKLEGPGPCGSVVGGGDILTAERKEVVDQLSELGLAPLKPAGIVGAWLVLTAIVCKVRQSRTHVPLEGA